MHAHLRVLVGVTAVVVAGQLVTWLTRYAHLVQDLLINEQWVAVPSPAATAAPVTSKNRAVHDGYRAMKATNVTVLGVGRNLGPHLRAVLAQVDAMAALFGTSRAIFVEGGSTDRITREVFARWAAASPANRTVVTVDTEARVEGTESPFRGHTMPREGRLAQARNVGLRALHSLPQRTEYVVVVDLDVLGWDLHGVADSFGRRATATTPWDVMCANGILLHGVYRDTYAFRTDSLNTNHHWAGNDHVMYNITVDEKKVYRQNLRIAQRAARTMMDFSNLQGVVRVDSCFGGLAIYRYDAMVGCQYEYRHREPPHMLDCEHVLLHRCMIDKHGAKVYANSNLKLWYGHSPLATLTWTKLTKWLLS
jgi:hypothetical protein